METHLVAATVPKPEPLFRNVTPPLQFINGHTNTHTDSLVPDPDAVNEKLRELLSQVKEREKSLRTYSEGDEVRTL